jgi:hypothetical protein
VSPARGKARIFLLWNARNAGYLLTRQTGLVASPDLLLDVGVEHGMDGVKRIRWTHGAADGELAIPLGRDLRIHGTSHPTGFPAITSGAIDEDALAAAAALVG